ncbi:MAG TPA: hypothetical protein VL728_03360 [Cyclobacteriaceae bacterium]|jgi:hypothetical protein|nr:hypothetical protein [Cyclobacteriaceae bacterium]
MLAAVHVVLLLTIAFALARHWQVTSSKLYWSTLGFHLGAGISVGLIYTYYYASNDTWLFFEDANLLSQLAKHDLVSYMYGLADFTGEATAHLATHDFRSEVFIKILSFFSLVTGNNYWLCTAYFSLLSFGASWFLYRKITTYFEHSKCAAILAFLIFPSVVFWSSGIEKETVALTALYFLAGLFVQVLVSRKISVTRLMAAVLAAMVLWALKYYWAGVFFIAVISGLATNYLTKYGAIKKYLAAIYLACFAAIGIGVSFLHPNFYLNQFLEVVVSNHDAFVALSKDQNVIHFYALNPTVGSIAINAPWAVVSGIFRPFIGEGQGALGGAASLENLLILVLAVSLVWHNRKRFQGRVNVLLLTTLSYCTVLCVFLALSTPNLGTLSRYRVGFLPFLIFMLAYRNPLIDFIEKRSKQLR